MSSQSGDESSLPEDQAEPNHVLEYLLIQCGFTCKDHRQAIIDEGFEMIEDFRIVGEKDLITLVKNLSERKPKKDQVRMPMIRQKRLNALCFWVRDCHRRGRELVHTDFDTEMISECIQ